MDILIKGLEMPKNCCECDYHCGLNIIARHDDTKRHPSCPLVALPEHGDLKDYDKIKDVLTKNFDANADSLVYHILSLIEETDTIVEAST